MKQSFSDCDRNAPGTINEPNLLPASENDPKFFLNCELCIDGFSAKIRIPLARFQLTP